jgi:hypothetical protein
VVGFVSGDEETCCPCCFFTLAGLDRAGDDAGEGSGDSSDPRLVARFRNPNFIPESILEDAEKKEVDILLFWASLSLRFLPPERSLEFSDPKFACFITFLISTSLSGGQCAKSALSATTTESSESSPLPR